MIMYKTCPVCHSPAINKVLTAADHTVSNEKFEIWQCAACSLRFTQNIPAQSEIGRYYRSENYISHSNTGKGLINSIYLLVRRFTLSSKRKFVQRITGTVKGRLLDIGAGTGAFLHEMKHAGWQVEGVEPDSQAIKNAAAVHGLNLHPADHLFRLTHGGFDAITMWHVLEHVHELHEYIEQLKLLCKPGGKIFIAVPNYTSYDAEYYVSSWAAYDVPRHLYHFSPAAMIALITSHGCRIDSIHPMWFDSFYVSLLSEKYKTGSSNIIHGFWKGFRSNSKALSNKRKASSIIYVISV
ncbi:MAG: class I SAM-dependent methyltransferase [Chitinophagaceae bacterium]|nr:class I SAM-dependent methyltransferase [Chitinophagaceae bacterium]